MTPTHCGKWLAAKKDRDWKWYKRKMYSMCRIYTQNVYTLYYEEAHTHTEKTRTRDTRDFRITAFGLLEKCTREL